MTQPAASDIRVGTVLRDTYEISSLLGKGGMGTVFLARHRRLPGKQVAVKVLQNSASLNPELYARFRREAEIASQLGHPNIVQVLDFDTLQDGTPFLVMEYLRGESLEQRVERGPLPVDAALSIVRQIGSGLQAAHRAGVVHRDLKPANVFLVPTDSGGVVGEQVKLLDFGISKMLDSQTLQTQDAVLIGTPQYMAPEQALGKNSEIDARTDIFALGCIVYELLSGKPPFAGDGGSIVQVVFRIVHGQAEPLASLCPGLSYEVIGAVERALAKTPYDRYPDVASFIADLTGAPLQSLAGAAIPTFSSSRAASVPPKAADDAGFAATHMPSSTANFGASAAAPADEAGFAATHMPSSTARMGAPAATDDVGFAATHMPASTARFPAPAADPADEAGFAATHMPSSTARFPAPVAQPPPASPVPAPRPVSVAQQPLPVSPAPVPHPAAVVAVAEAPHVPASQTAPAPSGSRRAMVAGAWGLILALVALGGWWFGARSTPAPVNSTPATVAATAPAQQPAAPPEIPAEPKAPEPVAAVEPVAPASTPAPVATTSRPSSHPSANETVPEAVREVLQNAERALSQGNADEAIRLARSSQRTQPTSASYSVLTRAYCLKADLSNAKASWREGRRRMMIPKDRKEILRFCMQHDVELRP